MMDRKHFLRTAGAGALALFGCTTTSAEQAGVRTEVSALPPPETSHFWSAVRARFNFDPGLCYFNTGGLGPAAIPVREAFMRETDRLQNSVATGHHLFEEVRSRAAAFVGAHPDEIAFTRNATEGNGIIAGGLDLRAGDEVIFESHAHPGGSFPWLLQAQRQGIRVKVFEPDITDPAGNLAAIEALATRRTRVVQVSHVTAPTGIHLPVREIAALCQSRGWWFHVDGAQSLGMFPFDLHALGVDSYAASAHKWLGGPHETGLLYIRRNRLEEVTPLVAGAHTGHVEELPEELHYANRAARHEYGTRNTALVVGVKAAMDFQDEIGRTRLAQRGQDLASRFRAGLATLPDVVVISPLEASLRSPMVTIRSPRIGFESLFRRLWHDHGYRCRPVSEEGLDALRVSFHFFNLPQEVDGLLSVLEDILRAA